MILVFILFSSVVNAELSSEYKLEIEHLLTFVKNSSCEVDRNGSLHKGADAASHIRRKYHHFSDDIDSAEEFIKFSATKSTLSGHFYTVVCGDSQPLKTQDWLLEELKKFRACNS